MQGKLRNVADMSGCRPPSSGATVRVAIMQIGYETVFEPHGRCLEDNCQLLSEYLAEAGKRGADLAIAPECWCSVGMPEENRDPAVLAEEIPGSGPLYRMFSDQARRFEMHVLGWSYERDNGRIYNTAFILGPDGAFLGKYRKTHPVPIEETVRAGISPGEELPVFDLPFGRVGIMICFDDKFPEVSRILSVKGARLICFPSMNSPHHAWTSRSAVRAMDNGCFIASSLVLGIRVSEGEAAIYDPRGMIVASPGQRDGIAVGEIDLHKPYMAEYHGTPEDTHFSDVRRFLLANRRPHLYRDLTGDAII